MKHWTDTFFTGYWSKIQRGPVLVEEASAESAMIRNMLRLRRGSRVADIPCGDGRISLELARCGCHVVGIDSCESSIRRARRRRRREGLPAKFRQRDMRDPGLPREFDAVVNWWGSFGYFDDETNLSLLRGFADILVEGGRVLVEQVNREHVLRNFMRSHVSDGSGVRVAVRNRWDARRQRIEGTWEIGTGAARVTKRSSIRLYTPSQMRRLIRAAGLEVEGIYDSTTGLPLTRGSRRMSAVGRKLATCPSSPSGT